MKRETNKTRDVNQVSIRYITDKSRLDVYVQTRSRLIPEHSTRYKLLLNGMWRIERERNRGIWGEWDMMWDDMIHCHARQTSLVVQWGRLNCAVICYDGKCGWRNSRQTRRTTAHDSVQSPQYDALQRLLDLACQLLVCLSLLTHRTTRNTHRAEQERTSPVWTPKC